MDLLITITRKYLIKYLNCISLSRFFVVAILVFAVFWVIKKKYRVISSKEVFCFSIYSLVIIAITFMGRSIGTISSSWGTLFSTYDAWIIQGKYWVVFEVIYNAILFIPLGSILKRKSVETRSAIGYIFAISLAIELLQLITGTGLFEICDLIHNTLGGIIGIGLVVLFRKVKLKLVNQKSCGVD